MNPEVERWVRDLAAFYHISEEEIQQILAGWRHQFRVLEISEERQEEEFTATLRARVLSGCVSLVADLPG